VIVGTWLAREFMSKSRGKSGDTLRGKKPHQDAAPPKEHEREGVEKPKKTRGGKKRAVISRDRWRMVIIDKGSSRPGRGTPI